MHEGWPEGSWIGTDDHSLAISQRVLTSPRRRFGGLGPTKGSALGSLGRSFIPHWGWDFRLLGKQRGVTVWQKGRVFTFF